MLMMMRRWGDAVGGWGVLTVRRNDNAMTVLRHVVGMNGGGRDVNAAMNNGGRDVTTHHPMAR